MRYHEGMSRFIALLRGINVGGHNKVPMSDLRLLCTGLGWTQVQTYIQSGNVIFGAGARTAALEATLEAAIEKRFGLTIAVIVRAASDWARYAENNPFAEACEREPNLVLLGLSKAPPRADAAGALLERARDGERVERRGDAIWIHYAGGAARSKLSPALIDRLVGSSLTARNWRTVLALQALVRNPAG